MAALRSRYTCIVSNVFDEALDARIKEGCSYKLSRASWFNSHTGKTIACFVSDMADIALFDLQSRLKAEHYSASDNRSIVYAVFRRFRVLHSEAK